MTAVMWAASESTIGPTLALMLGAGMLAQWIAWRIQVPSIIALLVAGLLLGPVTGIVELAMRVTAAVVLGAMFGFVGVALSNPMAWIGAICLLIPSYIRAHRKLALLRVDPLEPTPTTPIAIMGPTDGSMVVDAIVTQPIQVIPSRRLGFRRRSL